MFAYPVNRTGTPSTKPTARQTDIVSKPVLFIGDSHTKGQLGASFVAKLQQLLQRQDLELLAYGVNGETTESITKRIAPILKRHSSPAAVFLLPGSNDCLAREHPALQSFYNFIFRLTRRCTLQHSLENVRVMLDRIRQETPGSKVFVITIPPHTEQPDQPAYQRVEQYNNALKQMISSDHPAVQVADFHTAFVQHLQQHHSVYEQYRPRTGSEPSQKQRNLHDMLINPWYNFSLLSMVRDQAGSAILHYCFRKDWNSISRRRGLYLLTDHVHMNDTAAGLLAEMLLPLVKDL